MALTTKQHAFVEHYLRLWDGAKAARAVSPGAKRPDQIAYEYLRKPEIQEAIQARLAELQMGADEVLTRLTDHARGSMEDFLQIERIKYHPRQPVPAPTPEDPKAVRWVEDPKEVDRLVVALDLEQARDRGKLHLLKKYKEGQWGPEIELHDPQAALTLLGKHHGLFVERTETALTLTDADDARTILAEKLARRAGQPDPEPGSGGG